MLTVDFRCVAGFVPLALMLWFLLLDIAVVVSPIQSTPMGDENVFQRALSGDAFVELRCRGLSADKAKKVFKTEYGERQRRVRAFVTANDLALPEVITIGHRCPYYRGAGKRLDAALNEADRLLQSAPFHDR